MSQNISYTTSKFPHVIEKVHTVACFNKCNESKGSHSSKFSSMVKVLFSRQRALQKKVKMHQATEFLAVQPTRVIYNFTGFCPFIINIKNLKELRQEN